MRDRTSSKSAESICLLVSHNRNTVSAVMSEDGEPTKVRFHVFDNFTLSGGFQKRFREVTQDLRIAKNPYVFVLPHSLVKTPEELIGVEETAIEQGYEGVMVRSLDGPYKQGRSTEKSQCVQVCLADTQFQEAPSRN